MYDIAIVWDLITKVTCVKSGFRFRIEQVLRNQNFSVRKDSLIEWLRFSYVVPKLNLSYGQYRRKKDSVAPRDKYFLIISPQVEQ